VRASLSTIQASGKRYNGLICFVWRASYPDPPRSLLSPKRDRPDPGPPPARSPIVHLEVRQRTSDGYRGRPPILGGQPNCVSSSERTKLTFSAMCVPSRFEQAAALGA
jgi:hypothetical protein